MPAIRKEPSDLVLTSTTEPQEALDHAVGEHWREPFVPASEKAAEQKAKDDAAKKEADVKAAQKELRDQQQEEELESKNKVNETEEEKIARVAKEHETKPEGKGGWSKRVDTLTARNTRLTEEVRTEREARERLEARLVALERGEKPASGDRSADTTSGADGTIPDLPGKPTQAQFKSTEEYIDKLIQWTKANEDNKEAVQSENMRIKSVFDAHRTRTQEARTRIDDYEEVMNDPQTAKMTLHPALHNAIMEMENGPDVLYHLATHPEAYKKLEAMSPLQGIVEMGRISDQIAARIKPNGAARKQRVTPPEPINAGGRRSNASGKPLADMETEDYISARRQMRQARRTN
jgi:hypothetical protein